MVKIRIQTVRLAILGVNLSDSIGTIHFIFPIVELRTLSES